MGSKIQVIYLVVGILFGGLIMSIFQDKNVELTDKQIDILSTAIASDVKLLLINDKINSYPDVSSLQFDVDLSSKDDLLSGIREEVATIVTEELRAYVENAPIDNIHVPTTDTVISAADYDRYHKATLLLSDITNGHQMSFQEFSSNADIVNLPIALKNKILGEVAMKLNSGELSADEFIGKNQ